MSVKFKGIDPERILNVLDGYFGWFFTKPVLIFNLLLMASALLLILVQFDVFQSRLPSFNAFFAAENWLLLGAVLAVTKILHEFGHGLSCKHLGGECHEMGVMLLVLTPCLYCNVSDSWMLPNRWHRAAIGAAGMYVELVLASICTFIWWFTEPGLLNYLCLNVMFVSSVSTLLFNANPLLKYDGYYILSDILEIPNLRQKASSILSRTLGKWCLGLEPPDDPFLPTRHQGLFAFYSVAAAVYRWVVVLSILYFLNKVFEPYGLKPLGQAIALMSIYGLLIQPLVKLVKYFRVPGRLGKVKRVRLLASTAVVLLAIVGIMSIPLPMNVFASLHVQPLDAELVHVKATGVLAEIPPDVYPGATVKQGQVLARLENLRLEAAVLKSQGQVESYRIRLKVIEGLTHAEDPKVRQDAQARKADVAKMLETAESQLAIQLEDQLRLTIRAPRDGVVIPYDRVPEPPADNRDLPTWWGTPFDERNRGATLEAGTPFCWVGDPNQLEARIAIEQDDAELVKEGYRVDVLLNQSAYDVYSSTVYEPQRNELEVTPARLSSMAKGPIATQPDKSGVHRPLTPHYYAMAPLRPDPARLRVGLVGTAKIETPDRTLAWRIWRYFSRTFNFDL